MCSDFQQLYILFLVMGVNNKFYSEKALPETRPLPSVHGFAECKISDSRQRASLPSAAHGKEKHTVNTSFAERHTLGKEKHSANNFLPSVELSAKVDTRQRSAGT